MASRSVYLFFYNLFTTFVAIDYFKNIETIKPFVQSIRSITWQYFSPAFSTWLKLILKFSGQTI